MTGPAGSGELLAAEGSGGKLRTLTWSQQLLWTGQDLHPYSPLYNMALAFAIEGPLDLDHFDLAFQSVLDRCDALRTVFPKGRATPSRSTLPRVEYRSERVDLSGIAEEDLRATLKERAARPFDLTAQLFDSALFQIGAERHVWFLNQHHLITDAWACTVLYEATSSAYGLSLENRLDDAPPLPSYEEYADFESRSRESSRHGQASEYWRDRASCLGPMSLYGSRAPRRTTRTERLTVRLGADRSDAVRALAREPGIRSLSADLSVFNVFMAGLAAYLHRVTGETRVSIGAPSHNRPTPVLKKTVGVCIEVFPLTVEVAGAMSFRDLLTAVGRETTGFLRNALPATSTATGNRAVNVVLNFIHSTFPAFQGLETRTDWIHPGHGDRAHDLRLQVHDFDDTGEFVLHFDFSVERFGPGARELAIEHFLRIMDGLLEDHEQPVEAPVLLGAGEAETEDVVSGRTSPPHQQPDTVVRAFEAMARAHPERPAVVQGSESWTYAQLHARVEALAGALVAAGARGQAVALATGRSAEAVVGILGALRAGASFVPVDPSQPEARSRPMLEETGARIALTRHATRDVAGTTAVLEIPGFDADVHAAATAGSLSFPNPDDAAYVLYTSGSTGRPKGVLVPHRALDAYARWAAHFYARGEATSAPLFTPLGFDLTLTSVFVPLLSGGTVVVHGGEDGAVDAGLNEMAAGPRVDLVKLTPAHLRALSASDLRSLGVRTLIVGGEQLTVSMASQALEIFGDQVAIFNEYGPTEATVGCTVHRFDPSADVEVAVPIGRPYEGVHVHVMDSRMRPQPAGVPGEIVIGGCGVAEGYVKRPEETRASFVRDPRDPRRTLYRTGDSGRWRTDGVLEYLGRSDRQVKVHGVRVELGEIEAVLDGHPSVHSSVVELRSTAAGTAGDATAGGPRDDLRHCARCGLPSTYPGADLDEQEVCQTCRSLPGYRSRVEDYFGTLSDLEEILKNPATGTGGSFDCLLMLSGGKDSSYALYRLVDMGLAVTTMTLDNGYISDGAKDNVRRITSELGVPHEFVTSPSMNQVFKASLEKHANVCHGCFKTMYTLAFNKALEQGIPFVVTGLSRGQMFETRLTEELFQLDGTGPSTIDRLVLDARKAYHRADEPMNRLLDNEAFRDDAAFDRVRFVDFYRYCDVPLDEMYSFLQERAPWIRPSDTGRSTNCLINDVGIWVHRKERGYHNYALPYSWDVRLGHKTRADALEELDDQIDEERVSRILEEVGYSPLIHRDEGARQRLVAYYVASENLNSGELRSFLLERLPHHMVPSRFVPLSSVPLTPHGKLDRSALPDPDHARPYLGADYVAPRTEAEIRMADLWAEALRLESVGVHDNFFELGGDSITAIRIGAAAADAGLSLDPNSIFRHQTVAELASFMDQPRELTDWDSVPAAGGATIDRSTRDKVSDLLKRADGNSG